GELAAEGYGARSAEVLREQRVQRYRQGGGLQIAPGRRRELENRLRQFPVGGVSGEGYREPRTVAPGRDGARHDHRRRGGNADGLPRRRRRRNILSRGLHLG